MSLIHEALKKAQQQVHGGGGGKDGNGKPFLSPEFVKPPLPRRIIVLGIVLFLALGFLGYSYFGRKKTVAMLQPKPMSTQPSSQKMAAVELEQLKHDGLEAYKINNIDLAWTKFTAATALDEKDPELWNNLGVIARRKKNIKKAEDALQKALALRPDYPEALQNLGIVKVQQGSVDEALALFEKALEKNPTYAEAFFHVALIAEQKGEMQKAHEAYLQFLKYQREMPPHLLDRVRERALALEP